MGARTEQDIDRTLSREVEADRWTSLDRRLREADRNIESLALLDVYGRVARLLLDLSEEKGGKRMVTQKISKQDMARMIGASREMVSKVMRDLEAGGYIISEGDHITITGA